MANLGFGMPAGVIKAPPPGTAPKPNIFNQSQGWLTQAGNMAGQAGGMVHPQTAQMPQLAGAATSGTATVGGTGLGQYMNPYTSQVINTTMADMNRGRQMALNDVGAQATAAGAFGGSRHGVAEGVTNTGFAQQAGQMAAGLRNQGFQNAQGMAQFDVGQQNQMGQFNAAQQNGTRQFNAGLNVNNNQFNAGQGLQAQMANQGATLAGAGQLGQLSNLGFGQGMAINQQQQQQGAQQQQMMQALINAAKGQFGGVTGQPAGSLAPILGMLGAVGGTQNTQSQNQSPGLFGGLGALLGMF